jgi:hypothetical protein
MHGSTVGSGGYPEKLRQNHNRNRFGACSTMHYSRARSFWMASGWLLPAMELTLGK